MSRSPDVAVIGGGIIGCSAAAMLAERGTTVTLYEATSIGAGASGRNLGAIQHPFDAVLAPLYRSSLVHYAELALLDDGFAIGAEPAGILMLNRDPDASRRQVARLLTLAPELEARFMDPAAVAEAEPSLVPGLAACRVATGYPVPPAAATGAYGRLAGRRGAALRLGVSAGPWLEAGHVRGVQLADGSRVAAGAVIVAGGPWTPRIVDPGGAWEPIRRTWGVTVQLELGVAAPTHVVEEDEVDAVNRPLVAEQRAAVATDAPPSLFSVASAAGVSTLGSTFLPSEPLDPAAIARLLVERGARYLPAIATAPVREIRVCARPQSVDGRPFIGPVANAEGLFVCAGHGPWGISTGPASAQLAIEALLDGAPIPEELAAARAV